MGGVLCENVGFCRPLLLFVDQGPFLGKRIERDPDRVSGIPGGQRSHFVCISFLFCLGLGKDGSKMDWSKRDEQWSGGDREERKGTLRRWGELSEGKDRLGSGAGRKCCGQHKQSTVFNFSQRVHAGEPESGRWIFARFRDGAPPLFFPWVFAYCGERMAVIGAFIGPEGL